MSGLYNRVHRTQLCLTPRSEFLLPGPLENAGEYLGTAGVGRGGCGTSGLL